MSVTLDEVKKLREATGASMMACKKALEENNGEFQKSIDALRKKGEVKAAEKSVRTTGQGVVHSYIHTNKKVGALVQLACETDFVAKNETFLDLANDLAMQVVASNPKCINPEEVDSGFIEKEKEIWRAQLKAEGKPDDKIDMIIVNKEKSAREEFSLMKQPYIKDGEKTIEALIKECIMKLGENIKVIKFVRFEV